MRVDREVVRQRIERALHEIDEIEKRLPATLEAYIAADAEPLRYELEHRLFIALQAILDIATHVAVVGGVTDLDTYRDAVSAMARLGVVDAEVVRRLEGAAGLRNALAHEYLAVDHAQVYAALRRADDIGRFAAGAWQWVEGG